MVAKIETNEDPEFNNLIVAIIFVQLIEEGSVNGVGVDRHQFTVAQRNFLGFGKSPTLGVISDAFVEQFF